MPNTLDKVQPPALPQANNEYRRDGAEQTNNVLRLFFRRLTGVVNDLLSTEDGGKYLYMPRGSFYSTVDQPAALANTGYPVEFESTYIGNGVTVAGVDNTRITVSYDGVYNFQVTLQTEHTNASTTTLYVWINKDGTDVSYGGKKFSVSGNNDAVVYWNFSIALLAGQYIEMYWATSDTALQLHTEVPTAPHPGLPSAVAAVSFVSNL